jgi:glycosyltransferase involved in cell wall biosynthesis
MKIFFIIPGSGDSFYCGNCFRDNLQATALRKAGHEVIVMPLYLPLRQESFRADSPLFFSAATYYTALKFFRNRRIPRWLRRITDSDLVLRLSESMSGTTSAKGMEDMTLSMIMADNPVFMEQVTQMADYIESYEKPDVIHLSSTLLIGIAKVLKGRLSIPIVCSVQDEEVWIDSLDEKYANIAWHGIAENVGYIDRFVATSEYYRDILARRMPEIKDVAVVYPGIDRERYAADEEPQDPTVGFFYRMNRLNGLDILAKAFVILKERGSVPRLKLKIGGGYTGSDKSSLRAIRRIIAPYKSDVEISDTYSFDEHEKFYASVSLICVPIKFDEGVGLYLCEAFAAGRPAVEPSTGSFPEIVGKAGVLYSPNEPEALADALEQLLTDREAYLRAASEAAQLSFTRYNDQVQSKQLENIYKEIGVRR